MLKKIKKLWSDPVWSKVIANGVIALITLFAFYIFELWPLFYTYIMKSYSVLGFIILIMFLLALIGIFSIVSKLGFNNSKRLSKSEEAILIDLSNSNHESWTVGDLLNRLGGTRIHIRHNIDLLRKKHMVFETHNMIQELTHYHLDEDGRAYLVKYNLIK